MFGPFRRPSESDAIAARLYGAIVAQARSPALYSDFGVPDTVDGRFEMVVLHLVLVLERLRSGDSAEEALAQPVFDLWCVDMDRSLRELGVGDLGVPKRMKDMTQRFYGRAAAYRAALAAGDEVGLADAIARNVFGKDAPGAASLAGYALAATAALAAMPAGALAGEAPPRFPEPAVAAATGAAA